MKVKMFKGNTFSELLEEVKEETIKDLKDITKKVNNGVSDKQFFDPVLMNSRLSIMMFIEKLKDKLLEGVEEGEESEDEILCKKSSKVS